MDKSQSFILLNLLPIKYNSLKTTYHNILFILTSEFLMFLITDNQ